MPFELSNSQTIIRVPLVISNAATIAAFPRGGFVTEQTTAAATRTRPTAPAQVGRRGRARILLSLCVLFDSVKLKEMSECAPSLSLTFNLQSLSSVLLTWI